MIKDINIVVVPSPYVAILKLLPGDNWWLKKHMWWTRSPSGNWNFDQAMEGYWNANRESIGTSLFTIFIGWTWDSKLSRRILLSLWKQPAEFVHRVVIISFDGSNTFEEDTQLMGGRASSGHKTLLNCEEFTNKGFGQDR